MRRLLAALLLVASFNVAKADDSASCAQFDWPLDTEKAWLAVPDLRAVESGEIVTALASGAFRFKLKPQASASLPKPPERGPAEAASNAGYVTFATVPKAGLVQVTLTDEGWIDMIQNGAYLTAGAHTGKRDCPGLRKSVRFVAKTESLILQISGARQTSIGIAIRPVE